MSWVTIIWSTIAAVSFTLAMIYLLIWLRERRSWAYLSFCILALGVIGVAAGEFGAMYAQSPTAYGTAVRWGHFAYGFVLVGSVGFVHFYFGTGRIWLLWAALGLRFLALVANFSTGLNLHIGSIQSLQPVHFLGESVAMLGEWTLNPWVRLGQLAALVQFAYVVDASLRLWRAGARESRRRALVVGGPLAFFIIFSSAQAGLVAAGVLRMPIVVSFPFLAVLLAMGYELSRDVLRAAQLARELRASEEQMQLAASAAELGLWTWDIPRDVIWFTDQARTLFGFTTAEPINFKQFLQKLHPEDREPVNQAVAKAMNLDGGEYECDYRVVRPDRPLCWVAARGRVEFNRAGQPALMRGISADITARKQAVEELRRSEEFRRAILDSVAAHIAVLDGRGVIVAVNARWRQFAQENLLATGEPARNIEIGANYLDVCRQGFSGADDSPQAAYDGIAAVLAGRTNKFTLEYACDAPQMSRWFAMNVTPLGPPGESVVVSHVDITDRRRAELESQRQRMELAHLSRVTMLGELSGSMAHELNQPLTAILSNAQAAIRFLAHENADLNEVRDILQDIVEQDNRAGEVIRRLRLLLKKGEVCQLPLDLNDVVEEVLKLIRSDLVNQGVTARTELAAHLPPVKADRVQLQQVLLNLMMNACDAMNNNAPNDRQLVVRTELCPDQSIRVSVADLGTGVAPDQLDQVFEPFFTTKPQGLGLGLSVCRTIITAHGGKLSALNGAERGAVFNFTLPAMMETGKGNSDQLSVISAS